MKKVAITGGIGSGKSTVAKIFSLLDVPIFYADLAARYIMINDSAVKSKLLKLLGEKCYLKDGTLNKKHIGNAIFTDDSVMIALNKIVHPAVHKYALDWFSWQKAPYALQESALVYESGHFEAFDKIISVSADISIRSERVMTRDKISSKEVDKRMQKQWPQEDKDNKADYVIYNDGSQLLIPQVLNIHNQLCS